MSGMKGTGSNHVKVDGVFVPSRRSLGVGDFAGKEDPGSRLHDSAIYSYDVRDLSSFLVPVIMLGAAKAAVADYRSRLETRRDIFLNPQVVGDTAPGQLRYARALSKVRAAQALVDRAVELTERANTGGGSVSDNLRAELKLDFLSVMQFSWEAIQGAVAGSGSCVFRESEFTQHLVRDAQVMLGHLTVDEDAMMLKASQILLGRAGGPEATARFV